MYRLLKLGVSLTEQAEAPGAQLDWMLAIDGVFTKHHNERSASS